MPIYEYRCPEGHVFEAIQSMSDDPIEVCEVCGASGCERVFHPIAVHFKGKGFYNTDYGKSRGKRGGDTGDSGSKDGGESKDSKPSKDSKSSTDSKPKDSGGSKGAGSKTTAASSAD